MKSTAKPPPQGRDEVKKAILDATEKLLLKRSPSEVSIREIAGAAKVKHPQIYRHFGSKNALIMAVHSRKLNKVRHALTKVDKLEGNVRTLFETYRKDRWRQIALARAMVDGVDPHLLQSQFPVMHRLVELIKARISASEKPPAFDAEVLAAAMGGMAMGWVLFEPFLVAATGLEDRSKDELTDIAIELLEEFVRKLC